MTARRIVQLTAVAAAALLTACANLAASYERQAAPVPAVVPQAGAGSTAASTGNVALGTGWQQLIQDDRLKQTVALALDNSRSLRLAVLAIAQARAAWQIQDAATQPTLKGSAGLSASHTPGEATAGGAVQNTRTLTAGLGVTAYELDLFGRVRNLKDAALDSYLSTEDAARSTRLSLVAEVANAWLTLAADRAQLTLSQETLASEQRTLALTQQRRDAGADSGLTLAQVATAVEAARRDAAALQSQVQQDRNALDLLVGAPVPEALLPTGDAVDAARLLAVPAGLSSAVLLQRPDVRAAEHLLQAANANIGSARAALYPSISLTAAAGTASRSLAELFKGGAWSFAPTISLPIFDGGAAKAGVRQAEVARDIRLATYEQTVQTAFREVADALAVRSTIGERVAAQRALVTASSTAYSLAEARWRAGATSYLDVLDAQRTVYAARQALITLQLAEQANRLALFKVLGGDASDTATGLPS